MARLVEAETSLGYRISTPNRDRCQDSLSSIVRSVAPNEDSKEHIKQTSVREVPHVLDVLKAAHGVHSRSAVVIPDFYESAESSF